MNTIKRDPRISEGAFTGRFHIVADRPGLSIESHATIENAREALSWLDDHEMRCEKEREKHPDIPRRERETYRIEEQK